MSSLYRNPGESGKGFSFKAPTQKEVEEIQLEFSAIIGAGAGDRAPWSEQRILTAMGMLNAYIYRAGMETHFLEQVRPRTKEQKGLHRVTSRLDAIANSGVESFSISTQSIQTYLVKWWPGASLSKPSLLKMRDILSKDFGLFTFTPGTFIPRKRSKAPDIENFDLVRALILYEVLEKLYCTWYGSFETLPDHRGVIVRLVFNALFDGIVRFHRKTMHLVATKKNPETVAVSWVNGIAYNIFGRVVKAIAPLVAEKSELELDHGVP